MLFLESVRSLFDREQAFPHIRFVFFTWRKCVCSSYEYREPRGGMEYCMVHGSFMGQLVCVCSMGEGLACRQNDSCQQGRRGQQGELRRFSFKYKKNNIRYLSRVSCTVLW